MTYLLLYSTITVSFQFTCHLPFKRRSTAVLLTKEERVSGAITKRYVVSRASPSGRRLMLNLLMVVCLVPVAHTHRVPQTGKLRRATGEQERTF